MAVYKFDIFDVLNKICKTDINFFDSLSEADAKQIYPLIAMRWLSGGKYSQQILNLNDRVNNVVFHHYKHPKLMYKLLMASTTVKDKRFRWIPRKSKKSSSLIMEVITTYHNCSLASAEKYRKIFDADDIMEMADDLGYEKEQLTKLKKELNE